LNYIAPLFEEHKSAEEIAYSPEAAIKEGIKMIQTLEVQMRNLKLGSKLREEVWAREISRSVIAVMADLITKIHIVLKVKALPPHLLLFVAVCYFYVIHGTLALMKTV